MMEPSELDIERSFESLQGADGALKLPGTPAKDVPGEHARRIAELEPVMGLARAAAAAAAEARSNAGVDSHCSAEAEGQPRCTEQCHECAWASSPQQWDASQIKQPGWDHVQHAFIEGAREARANPGATEEDFGRASDGYTKRVFEAVDPVSEAALRTESWRTECRCRKAEGEACAACSARNPGVALPDGGRDA